MSNEYAYSFRPPNNGMHRTALRAAAERRVVGRRRIMYEALREE